MIKKGTSRMRYWHRRELMRRRRRICACAALILCAAIAAIVLTVRIFVRSDGEGGKPVSSNAGIAASPDTRNVQDETDAAAAESDATYVIPGDAAPSEEAGAGLILVEPAGTESVSVSHHDEIQSVIDSIGQQYGAVGIQVAVVEGGTVTDSYAYGWAVLNEESMTVDHKIRVASISKVVTGITAMLLRDDGIIDLDQDISDYWGVPVSSPYFPNDPITIRSMLTHTSSILAYGDEYSTDYASVRQRLIDGHCTGLQPGSIDAWCYNNYAIDVLGMTLELAANKRVGDILQDKLFTPMEIDASYASGDIQGTDKLATLYGYGGYVELSQEFLRNEHQEAMPAADGALFAGGLTISALDLAKLTAMLSIRGKYNGIQLLDAESVEQMETYFPQPLDDGTYQAEPLRYMPDLYGRDGIYFHTGNAYGALNCMSYDPATGDGVVVLTTGALATESQPEFCKVYDEINAYIYEVIDANRVTTQEVIIGPAPPPVIP